MGTTAGPSHIPVAAGRKAMRRGPAQLGLGPVHHGFKPAAFDASSNFIIKRVFDDDKQGFTLRKPTGKRAPEQREREAKKKELRVRTNVSHIPFPQPEARKQEDDGDYILVMGSSGAGKTSFINTASGSQLPISSGLKSCTRNVDVSEPFILDGKKIRLIDTPGYDDSDRRDADVLGQVADFLAKEFLKGRKLQGVLYFHRISDVRLGAVSKRNFTMFQKLCGEHTYPNVALVTSRWSEVNEQIGIGRENELKSKDIFFKPLLDAGASISRYDRTIESAYDILRKVLHKPPVTLSIQRETVLERKTMAETEAGKALCSEQLASILKTERELKVMEQELEAVKLENDIDAQRDLEADVNDLRTKKELLEEENRHLLNRQSKVKMVEFQDRRSRKVSVFSWVEVDYPSPRSALAVVSAPWAASGAPEASHLPEVSGADTSTSPRLIGALPKWEEKRMEEEALWTKSRTEKATCWTRRMHGGGVGCEPSASGVTWTEWLFGYPSSLSMTFCYILGGSPRLH